MQPEQRLKRFLVAGVLTVLAMACGAPATPPPQGAAAVSTPTAVPTLSSPVQSVSVTAIPPAPAAPTATPPAAVAATAGSGPTARLPLTVATLLPQAETNATGPATETSGMAGRFEAALNVADVDKALALFADTAEVKVPPDRYVGHTQIADWLNYLASIH